MFHKKISLFTLQLKVLSILYTMKQKSHLTFGVLLIILSSALYGAEVYFDIEVDSALFTGVFFLHYVPTIIYFFVVRHHEPHFWRFFQRDGWSGHTLLLVLFNICAYSLNRTFTIFNESVAWLTVFLLIENILLIIYAMLNDPPRLLKMLMSGFFGAALLFNIYQLFMVLPATPFGIIGVLFFGISLLLFVPAFYIVCIVTLLRTLLTDAYHLRSFLAGTLLTIVVLGYNVYQYTATERNIVDAQLSQDAPFARQYGLPDWIAVAQELPDNHYTEKYLKIGLVYQDLASFDNGPFSAIFRSSLDERYLHDPLISIASLFVRHETLDLNTKLKILNFQYDARHQTSDRFWSGENLSTQQVVTNVELFPRERLSFTEQVLTIKNDRDTEGRWRSQQEALYTFHLPEGGVVTSLSLWINGMEEKGVLTSKKKAEQAYNTIVGREVRDPSVVYWMEGNQIRVRVFPCTPEEDRKFKIGVTAPLALEDDLLTYQAISFKGPDYSKALSAVHVVTRDAEVLSSSIALKQRTDFYTWSGKYQRDWQLSIKAPEKTAGFFSFQGEQFKVEKTTKSVRDFKPQQVYLDVSNAWTERELQQIGEMTAGLEVTVFTSAFQPKNTLESIVRMSQGPLPMFTLFPFQEVTNREAVIITKGGMATPNFSDINNTGFRNTLFAYLRNQDWSPLVIDISLAPTDYMKSLKEFDVIDYHAMGLDELVSCFNNGQFPKRNEDPDVVVIPQNGLSIRRSAPSSNELPDASDHLMRLFYYQDVLSDIGNQYFTNDQNDYIETQIVDKAATANIVTPLSSLIVLESQADYDRFGIEQKDDALGNATIGNAGAVPEPHEWAMIFMGCALLLYMYRKSRKTVRPL